MSRAPADPWADPRDDETLLAALADGDRGALRVMFDRHAPWLVLRLSRRCADPGVVEEVVQDTFVAVWRHPRRYRGDGVVAAWLSGIAIRRLIDRLRSSGFRAGCWATLRDPSPTIRSAPSAEEQVLLGIEHGDLACLLNRRRPTFPPRCSGADCSGSPWPRHCDRWAGGCSP